MSWDVRNAVDCSKLGNIQVAAQAFAECNRDLCGRMCSPLQLRRCPQPDNEPLVVYS
jgi:hypothetical protein